MRQFACLLALSASLAPTLGAQRNAPVVGPIAIALGAERRGDLEEAAKGFFGVLESRPADGLAILGLARVLPTLDRRRELMAPLGLAVHLDSTNIGFLSLAVRNWALLGEQDSARTYVERWAALVEGDEEPFREWALSALEVRDRAAAKAALELGRTRIAHPAALAPELAQLRQAEGDPAGAAAEWLRAVTNAPTYRASAVLLLGTAVPKDRPRILEMLQRDGTPEAHRLRGMLRLKWGEPEAGVAELAEHVPESLNGTMVMIRLVLDELGGRSDPEARRAEARANELLAGKQVGEARVRALMAAATAWADAGEEREARRLLALIATDPAAPPGVATSASNTLLGVLLAEGSVAEAESLYTTLEPNLSLDERDLDRRRIALAWAMAEQFDRATALLATDSSVAAFDVRGRVHALAGELGPAGEWLRLAGPYAEERLQAVERVQLLTLIRAIGEDTLPAFGAALRALERGDTVTAVAGFGALAGTLAAPGAAALRLFAGDLALARGDTAATLALVLAADSDSARATAPAARMVRARILAARGQAQAASELLEGLILAFPESAVVPEARRLRDQFRGAVPSEGGG
ncbi:MAG TPA: hypothetical protein VFN22_03610 [Gemmatimonadales bacterium]|nr:hypothetical protein [Gemmatimonadales bacterium]